MRMKLKVLTMALMAIGSTRSGMIGSCEVVCMFVSPGVALDGNLAVHSGCWLEDSPSSAPLLGVEGRCLGCDQPPHLS